MKLFLLVYDRKAGVLLARREFSAVERAEALKERLAQERFFAEQDDVEVVLMGADGDRHHRGAGNQS